MTPNVVVVGAGMGGLTAALDLARQGCTVTVVEQAEVPGGKIRQLAAGDVRVDAGPTVLTMRWIFEELFAAAGSSLERHVALKPAAVLARHAWSDTERLDLHADLERSVEAIGAFAGRREAEGYRKFCARARRIFETLDEPFMRRERPRLDQLVASYGLLGLGKLRGISPFETMIHALREHFRDPRLVQLFGRYATYCGSSPYLAPATLMLVAHVEREGVWLAHGGIGALARAVADLAARHGACLRYGTAVQKIDTTAGAVRGVTLADGEALVADAVVVNADSGALGAGLFGGEVSRAVSMPAGRQRSLSAVTFAFRAETAGFPLVRHNVFFSRDYPAEFTAIFAQGRVPDDPTVYVCAQDRDDDDTPRNGTERLLCLVNAPPNGDTVSYTPEEIARCEDRMRTTLARSGLRVLDQAKAVATPTQFDRLFPGTGGALYGPASHGWQASFQRSGSRSKLPGLYLAGGSVHPGPGVPMAAISGRLAAAAILADLPRSKTAQRSAVRGSTSPSGRTAMPGGTSMP